MLLVALTGGIAVGKSVVAAVLKDLGCTIHDSDAVAHDLMSPDSPAWEEIVSHFGSGILNPDRTINRKQLGRIVFASESERLRLNGILHSRIMKSRQDRLEALERDGTHTIFVSEAALTVEAGFATFYDKVIVVHCGELLQIQRLMDRNRIDRAEAERAIQSQMPQNEKKKHGHYLIDSSGSMAETVERTEIVYRHLVLDYELKQHHG
ncbi:MAG: dephospho-CoA kinase [Candidatus Aminicenantes bacterium]|nr:dephospho-CoA kinase [Candidatus Aminicenantes bacterium]